MIQHQLNLILEKGREMLMPYMDEEIALIIKNPSSKYLEDLPNFTFNPEYFMIKSKKRHS